jgi:hypothetical protein
MLKNGYGIAKSEEQALIYCKLSANQGFEPAIRDLEAHNLQEQQDISSFQNRVIRFAFKSFKTILIEENKIAEQLCSFGIPENVMVITYKSTANNKEYCEVFHVRPKEVINGYSKPNIEEHLKTISKERLMVYTFFFNKLINDEMIVTLTPFHQIEKISDTRNSRIISTSILRMVNWLFPRLEATRGAGSLDKKWWVDS